MNEEEKTVQYQLKISKKLWHRFRSTVDKNETINDVIEEMIEERCKEKMV